MQTGDLVSFGAYQWRVLDIKDGKALLLSDQILATSAYGEHSAWEECELRRFLNEQFYVNSFSAAEQARIAEVEALGRIFLLSAEEVVRYFGDSGQLASGKMYIDDEFNAARAAYDGSSGAASWWWLRAPGDTANTAVCVGDDGCIYVYGHGVTTGAGAGGVRPALWAEI